MNLQGVIDELKNIKEQATNDDEITKGSIINAITDIIHDVEGWEDDFMMEDTNFDDNFSRVDFTQLEV